MGRGALQGGLGEGGVCVLTQGSLETLAGSSLRLTIFDRYERYLAPGKS
jgi:hypothetical protein